MHSQYPNPQRPHITKSKRMDRKLTFAATFENIMKDQPKIGKQLRYLVIRFLISFFLMMSYCVAGALLFKLFEGDHEAAYKCGKIRVYFLFHFSSHDSIIFNYAIPNSFNF